MLGHYFLCGTSSDIQDQCNNYLMHGETKAQVSEEFDWSELPIMSHQQSPNVLSSSLMPCHTGFGERKTKSMTSATIAS